MQGLWDKKCYKYTVIWFIALSAIKDVSEDFIRICIKYNARL